ncbi:MAG TPA: PLP-dependent aminotransferase family protein, partial [Polyangiaceae bacterium]|nr:PLP-dependent aminotransferase family protein [Polyangiaceae bacterium]
LRGRLKPGDVLPGSRTLAASLGVHRNTVLAAYRELEAEGFTEASLAKDTRVSRELPASRAARSPALAANPRATAVPSREHAGFDLGAAPPALATSAPPRGTIALYGGVPDLSMVPTRALARAYRRALASTRSPLGYGDPAGEPRLRAALAEMASRSRGVAASAEDVLVTRGSQMALYLAARTLLRPGDAVAVEAWGYRPAWEALAATGAELVPVPVDREGLDVERLVEIAGTKRLRAVYVTPHHQYPTTALLSQARRMQLLAFAKRERVAILEDDYDHEFHYDNKPVLPLASRDEHGVVVYFATLSKILAPGLRLGFVVAPRAVLARMTAYRALVDRQGDRAVELAIAELAEDGEIERHARRMRRTYASRRDAFVELLSRRFDGVLEWETPAGGMAVWCHAPGLDVDAWAARAEAAGVALQTAQRFAFDGRRRPFLRLGFAGHDERRLRLAVERLARALDG